MAVQSKAYVSTISFAETALSNLDEGTWFGSIVRRLRKVTGSFVLYVRMEQLGSHWTDFHGIRCLSFIDNLQRVKFSLKSDKNNRYFTRRPIYIFDHISRSSS